MSVSPPGPGSPAADPCGGLRREVTDRCQQARETLQAHADAAEQARLLRRDLVSAQYRLAAAQQAADPRARLAAKSASREAYQLALLGVKSELERTEALAAWAHELDRINRAGRLATRTAAKSEAEVADLQQSLLLAERSEQIAHVQAVTAEADCLDARVRLAACEERLLAPTPVATSADAGPPATMVGSAGGDFDAHTGLISAAPHPEPLVMESLVSGDRRALELAAAAIAERGYGRPAQLQLQLQELVDAIQSVASTEGYLVFDGRHPFWASLDVSEARDVMGALARLGFRFEPNEGWHAGRAPTPADLSIALAYAGLDTRTMRGLPDAAALRALPASIMVDARAFLAAVAPDLAVEHLVRLLESHAATLAPLWDAWGLVRPVLLSQRRSLGSLPG